jgi:curli biogenesis system outer membrane secretion channel CsgG
VEKMKKLMSVFMLCLLASVVVIAAEPPAAGDNTAGGSGNAREPTGGILKRSEQTNVIVREVIGRGHDRDEAIKDALYRAVEQSRGVGVDTVAYEYNFRGAGAGISGDGPDGRRIDFDSVDVTTRGTAYTTEIEGLVKSYDVIEEQQVDADTYQVKLRVSVYDYAVRGQTKRVKIALMPAKTLQPEYDFLNTTIPADVLSKLFSQRLAMGLTQTNKFAVLDRESISDFAKERNMLVSFDAPLAEQAKLAETLGADYLLIGTISQAKIEKIEKYLKTANYTATEFKARFKFDYRLVDSATKQIVIASAAEKYLENQEVRKLADEQSPLEWDAAQVRDAFLTLVANDVIEAIIDRVYPVKIAAVQPDGQVILNQGGERMAEGMILDVYSMGEEIFDSDTNESLGRIESLVATIEVHKVSHNMSFAAVVSGDASKITKGLVCRLKEAKKKTEAGAKPNIKRTESGGVVLPFDR